VSYAAWLLNNFRKSLDDAVLKTEGATTAAGLDVGADAIVAPEILR